MPNKNGKRLTNQEDTPGSSVAGNVWLPPLPKATPILTSGTDMNEYNRAFPSTTGIKSSCKWKIDYCNIPKTAIQG